MVAVWNSDETSSIATHFDGRVADRADTVFDYGALSAAAGSAAQGSNSGSGGDAVEEEEGDDSWMDMPDEPPAKANKKAPAKKGGSKASKGKGKGKK